MKPASSEPRGHSLVLRTALWCWFVTLITLLIFAAALLPQQQEFFRQNLRSKAHGIMLSLRKSASDAASSPEKLRESSPASTELINGDPLVDFVVISRHDRTALITERFGSRYMTNLSEDWHPDDHMPRSGIGILPPFENRVFYYSHPLDSSGTEHGWIHIGLSLDGYLKSLAANIRRTTLLVGVCGLISLLASGLYARRHTQPILNLRSVVQKIADGNLDTRVQVDRNDELGALARSVNTMAEALQRRGRILESVRFAAQEFLSTPNWHQVAQAVLARTASAAMVSRAYVVQSRKSPGKPEETGVRFDWTAPGTVAPNPAHADAPTDATDVSRVLTLPIHCEGELWGFLSLDNGAQTVPLTEAETESLRAVADILGATIARQHAQDALLEATQSLEHRVEERTRALRDQVAAEERARAELAQAQQSLIETSRLAGMAEVATSVLHNVGNVLNSVGVSATLVTDRIRRSKAASLARAAAMIRNHSEVLATFLTTDPKGKLLPEYLEAVCQQVVNDHAGMLKELEELVENVEHIKKIVAMQQTYAKVSGTVENLPIADLVDDALRMNAASFESANITVLRQIAPNLPQINVDRHRVLQILINLLRNAKQALDVPEVTERRLEIGSFFDPDGKVIIRVRDTGVGIAPENMTRIFQHGFTTKKEGHGFGLHSGANVAKEMGGRLTAQSDGPGRGAVFTLELPLALRQPALP